jgi:hypothetical protein
LELGKQKLIEGAVCCHATAVSAPMARLFANPYYFRFNAERLKKIDLGDLHDSISGPALYEIMMLGY